MPEEIKKASFKDIYKDDKGRVPIIKYFKEFTGVTPRSYVSMVRQDRLYQKIENIGHAETDHHHHETFTPKEWKTLFLAE